MDYFHYRFLHWKVGEYISLPYGAKKIAHAYLKQFINDRNEEIEAILATFSGKEGGN